MLEVYRKPSDGIIGYTAGMLDGEGSIHLMGKKGDVRLVVCQSVKNGGENLVNWLRDQWDMGRCRTYTRVTNLDREVTMWQWEVSARRDLTFLLETLLPYLRVKHDKATQLILCIKDHIDDKQRWTVWTSTEDEFLIMHYQSMTNKELAEQLNRSLHSVAEHGRKLGLRRPGGRGWASHNTVVHGWSRQEDDYLREHYGKVKATDIADGIGRSLLAVQNRAGILGITRQRGERRKLTTLLEE